MAWNTGLHWQEGPNRRLFRAEVVAGLLVLGFFVGYCVVAWQRGEPAFPILLVFTLALALTLGAGLWHRHRDPRRSVHWR
ncbi:hypothetical protein GCM10012275_20970 [Longimycelium tulufanense]|uniref:Uncharacterized protein n=1 Tax=Longimycelium tulufanense TaxID=907463 RepID=A0A8J3FTW0_9PSEU|nr:hypothetical protein [Longimycelium tulufanense]GGM49870.1 hypothetical protein GCM10012275_20970 [Longimycelium tulufanense]